MIDTGTKFGSSGSMFCVVEAAVRLLLLLTSSEGSGFRRPCKPSALKSW